MENLMAWRDFIQFSMLSLFKEKYFRSSGSPVYRNIKRIDTVSGNLDYKLGEKPVFGT